MNYTDEQIREVMEALALDHEILTVARTDARVLEVLKRRTKKTYKKLALRWHPDREGGDEDLFKLVGRVVDEIQNMRVVRHPRSVKWAVHLRARVTTMG